MAIERSLDPQRQLLGLAELLACRAGDGITCPARCGGLEPQPCDLAVVDGRAQWTCRTCATRGGALELVMHEGGLPAKEAMEALGQMMPSLLPRKEAAAAISKEPELAGEEPLSKSYASLCRIFRTPALWRRLYPKGQKLEYNEMGGLVTIGRRALRDSDVGSIRERIETRFEDLRSGSKLQFPIESLYAALIQVAEEHPFHPVREYLSGLKWDGVERIAYVPEEVLQLESPSVLTKTKFRKFLISAVARAFHPGCKVDTVLILKGLQGKSKSTFFETLAGEDWFADTSMNLDRPQDAFMGLARVWIYEWAELNSMLKARDQETVKSFITSRKDLFRVPYGRAMETKLRSSVLVGTTNKPEFFRDEENRRYHVIVADRPIRLDKLKGWRSQLWAEAVQLYNVASPADGWGDGLRAGEKWWMSEDEEKAVAAHNRGFAERDAWDGPIAAWLHGREGPVTTSQILVDAIGKDIDKWSNGETQRVAHALRRLGWKSRRGVTLVTGERARAYFPKKLRPAQQSLPIVN